MMIVLFCFTLIQCLLLMLLLQLFRLFYHCQNCLSETFCGQTTPFSDFYLCCLSYSFLIFHGASFSFFRYQYFFPFYNFARMFGHIRQLLVKYIQHLQHFYLNYIGSYFYQGSRMNSLYQAGSHLNYNNDCLNIPAGEGQLWKNIDSFHFDIRQAGAIDHYFLQEIFYFSYLNKGKALIKYFQLVNQELINLSFLILRYNIQTSIIHSLIETKFYSTINNFEEAMSTKFNNFLCSSDQITSEFKIQRLLHRLIFNGHPITMECETSIPTIKRNDFSANNSYGDKFRHLLQQITQINQDFYLRIHRGLIFQIKAEIKANQLIVKGILLYENGMPFTIADPYVQMFTKLLEVSRRKVILHYSRTHHNLKLKATTKFKIGSNISSYHMMDLIEKISDSINPLLKVLSSLGLHQIINKHSVKTKSLRIQLLQNITKILNKQTENRIIPKNSQNGYQKQTVCPFTICKSIKQIKPTQQDNNGRRQTFLTNTNMFVIEKKMFEIVTQKDQSVQMVNLAVKRPIESGKIEHKMKKIEWQASIIEKIQDLKYSITYWRQSQPTNKQLYMEYIKDTLEDLIYRRYNSIQDIIDFSNQIIHGVRILHQSGVVHRDLKPNNILVEQNDKRFKLKIIDFGQSSHQMKKKEDSSKTMLGYTLPYSPLECSQPGQKGIYSKQIDNWSIGLILYEIAFQKLPITYSQPFAINISKGWKIKDQFSIYPKLIKAKGIKILQLILNIVSLHSVCIEQQSRISIEQMIQIFASANQFLTKMTQL